MMSKPKSPSPAAANAWDPMDPVSDAERRRFGRIDRDERGQAVVTWVKPPRDWERRDLSLVEDDASATASRPAVTKGYDPYESTGTSSVTWNTEPTRLTRPARTDLRRLSEHIKQMRALKERQDDK